MPKELAQSLHALVTCNCPLHELKRDVRSPMGHLSFLRLRRRLALEDFASLGMRLSHAVAKSNIMKRAIVEMTLMRMLQMQSL
eukprot:1470755-Amphidinium_carterae.1